MDKEMDFFGNENNEHPHLMMTRHNHLKMTPDLF